MFISFGELWVFEEELRHVKLETEIYLSLFWAGTKLGISYYDANCHQIFNMTDTYETAPDFEVLRQVIYQVQADYIVASARTDERLIQMLNGLGIKHKGRTSEDENRPQKLILLPSIDFGLDSSKRRIANLQLPNSPKLITDADRAIFISSLVNFQCISMVRALGGLLRYIDKHRIGVQLEERGIRVPIIAINSFSLENTVAVDENTFRALQIFQQEWHPSVYKIGSGQKEGLSLYGILNRCKSVIGSKALKIMMLRPTTDIEIIQRRQEAILYFTQLQNTDIIVSLERSLAHVKNLPTILGRMAHAEASVRDWKSLYNTLYNALVIGDLAKSQPQEIYLFKKIDFDESAAQCRFVVKWGIDADLDKKKQNYNTLPELMSKVAKEELQNLSHIISTCCVVYLPQLGYLLEIPMTPDMEITGNLNLPALELVFASNKMVYYRSERTLDHETKIMINLQAAILEHSPQLIQFINCIAELDCLLSLAVVAKNHNYFKPDMTQSDRIFIKAGRHPLQELCVSVFVPNDTFSSNDVGKMKLLTGPNTCGKSVYLKQVALIVYMAHIGSFIPASQAEICIVPKILTRIYALDSISTGLSTFMIDLNQMAHALQNANNNSLVIIDEFGIGTDYVDGVALMVASLKYWLNKGVESSPHLFITTHFHNVLSCIAPTNKLELLTMDIMQENDELVYLYQLTKGHINSSFAIQVAKHAGLDQKVIDRANQVLLNLRQNKPIQGQEEIIDADMEK
uniref:DNA mismatch repair proteins mutS family domain-containing protein n=1 Tax=Strigamia maritima TaxID=126957 RepID=T1ITD3_STRMM